MRIIKFYRIGDMNKGETKFISLAEAAKLTKYKQDYLGLLCRQGKLKGEKFGRNWVTTKGWILKYVEKIESKSEEIILVKVVNSHEEKEENKTKKLNIGYPKIGKLLPIKKLILAALAISVAVSGFIFADGKLENFWSDKRAIAEFVISERASNTLRYRSCASPRLSQEIISFSNSLGVISDNGRNAVQTKLAKFSRSKNIILFAVFNKAGKGRVAGVESLNGSGDNYENNKGLIVVPLEGDINSTENRELVEKLSSSFSDEVNIKPSEDGVSGTITSKEYPDDNFLYLMVPVNEK